MQLDDKVAAITGGTAGIGRAIAEAFLAEGAERLAPLVDLYDEDWDLVMKWNLYSTFWGTRAALRHMLPRGYGRIINISSVEGKHGKPVLTAYVAAKHAINVLTKAAAKEVGTQGVTVNAESAIKRPNTLDEVAAVAVLLASDVGAGITGAIYSVDGGTAAY